MYSELQIYCLLPIVYNFITIFYVAPFIENAAPYLKLCNGCNLTTLFFILVALLYWNGDHFCEFVKWIKSLVYFVYKAVMYI